MEEFAFWGFHPEIAYHLLHNIFWFQAINLFYQDLWLSYFLLAINLLIMALSSTIINFILFVEVNTKRCGLFHESSV